MKPTPKLWRYDQGDTRRWFYTGRPYCYDCDKEVFMGYYITNWNKNNYFSELFCDKCAKDKTKMNMHMQEIKVVLVCTEPPPTSIPIMPSYPSLTGSKNLDVFSAATQDLGGETTIDRTKLAGRAQPVEVEYVGKPLLDKPEENRHLEVSEFDALISDIQNSELVLPESKTKKLVNEHANKDNTQE